MCITCEPGLDRLAGLLTRGIDIHSLAHANVNSSLSTQAHRNTDTKAKLFHNGHIYTLSNDDFFPVEALIVRNGVISHAGSLETALAAEADLEHIDLKGKCIVPGFIEPHLHLILTALADYVMVKLSPLLVTTVSEAKEVLRSAITDGKVVDGWLAGYGFDPSRVEGHPDLDLETLDSVDDEVAFYVLNQSGHVAYVNTAAFAKAGVTASNVISNKNFQQVEGKLTGVLFEDAVAYMGKFVPAADGAALLKDCASVLEKWISLGCTTIFDAGLGSVGPTDFALTAALSPTPIRYYAAVSGQVVQNFLPLLPRPPFQLDPVEVRSVKFWADGSTQGFTAAVTEEYLDPPKYAEKHGILNYPSVEAFQKAMTPWLRAGFQIVVHANGDAASDMVLDAYEEAFKAYPDRNKDIIHRIEHFTVVRKEQIQRAKELGLSVSHTIGHVHYWGQTFQDYVLGEPRASSIHPLKSDVEAELVFSLHSDSPVTDVDPLLYLRTATTRLKYKSDEVLGKEQKVDLLTALQAITLNPAKQIGVADLVGSLEVNKRADMVVLDKDIKSVKFDSLNEMKVDQTWIDGVKVFQRLDKS